MKIPKVSVCIPAYNYGEFIGEAIQSVLDQTFGNFELIIVDNCSTDNTYEIVKSFKDKRIKYHRNSRNIGMVKNFNRCKSFSKGEYLLFICADDKISPQMLEIASKVLDENQDVAVVYSACYTIDEKSNVIDIHKPFEKDHIWNGNFELLVNSIRMTVGMSTALVRKKCLDDVGGFDEKLEGAFDFDMWFRIWKRGYRGAYISEPLASMRRHERSGSVKSKLEPMINDECRILNKYPDEINRFEFLGLWVINFAALFLLNLKYDHKNIYRIARFAREIKAKFNIGFYDAICITPHMIKTVFRRIPIYWRDRYLLFR